LSARLRVLAALLLVLGASACKKKPATPPAGGAPAAQGAQKAPPPGSQKAPAAGAQKGAPAGSQKAAPPQPGQQKAPAGAQKAAPAPAGQQKAAPAQQAQQQKAPPAAPGRPGAPAAAATAQTPAGAAGRPDSAAAESLHVDYRREVYSYQGGPRDPFTSLLTTNEAQISVADLHVVSILYDPRGSRSVAIVRDRNSPRPFRVHRGDTIGRLRVIQIRQYEVVFQVEEFGFERQEVLSLPRVEGNR
jgi:hypothetical protein